MAAQTITAPSATVVMSYSFHKLPEVADAAAALRQPRRLLLADASPTTRRRHSEWPTQRCFITRYRLEKKDPERGDVRAGEADRVLPRREHAEEVGAVDDQGRSRIGSRRSRRRASRTRSSAKDCAERSGLVAGRRALLRGSLASVHDGERVRAERARSALRRDSQRAHPVLSQRAEPGAHVVFHAGRGARPARAARSRSPIR